MSTFLSVRVYQLINEERSRGLEYYQCTEPIRNHTLRAESINRDNCA